MLGEKYSVLLEMTTGIVGAYVSNNPIPASDLPNLIERVSISLAALDKPQMAEPEPLKPHIPIRKTIADEYLISLEDGKKYKLLKRHLTTRGLTPDEYRAKWGLPSDYPMAAPGYSAMRSDQAKRIGLGRKPVAKKTTTKRGGRKAR